MTNVEILSRRGQLSDVRERLGAKDAFDNSRDERINSMEPKEVVETYSAWNLGSGSWAGEFIDLYDELRKEQEAQANMRKQRR